MIDPNSNGQEKTEEREQESAQNVREDPAVVEEQKAADSKPAVTTSKKRDPIERLDDLLRVIYSGKHNRVVPKKKEIAAMRVAAESGLTDQDELLTLARGDRTLGRTLDLFLICAEQFNLPLLVTQTRSFVQETLLKHPVFVEAKLLGVLTGDNKNLMDSDAVRALSELDYAKLDWPDNGEPLKKSEADLCKLNSIACLLMWLREEDEGMTSDRIQRLLEVNLWRPAALSQKTELAKLKTLMHSKEPAALAIARENLTRELNQIYKQKEDAVASGEKAIAHAGLLGIELDEQSKHMASIRSETRALEKKCSELEKEHRDKLAHHQYDYEKLKGRVLRRLDQELELLDVGLSALHRDPPKVHVMIDHAERAIDGLKKEMERIRNNE